MEVDENALEDAEGDSIRRVKLKPEMAAEKPPGEAGGLSGDCWLVETGAVELVQVDDDDDDDAADDDGELIEVVAHDDC